mmetsp:Transcript_21003/g.34696  ORF Transcript_21003/g.34696 Transcript_21003/m.34696 type:complete len:302 (+) Transcript_21003:179-1084(+)
MSDRAELDPQRQRAAELLLQFGVTHHLELEQAIYEHADLVEGGHTYARACRSVLAHLRRGDRPETCHQVGLSEFVQRATEPAKRDAAGNKRRRPGPFTIDGPSQSMPIVVTPPMAQDEGRFAVFIPRVFTHEECAALIERTEASGYAAATMSIAGGGSILRTDIRDNDRCTLTDRDLAALLWTRIKQHLPEQIDERRATRLNEFLRFYRYERGQSFKKHMDDSYVNGAECSLLTVLLYLNEGFQGGATRLCTYEEPDDRAVEVRPACGGVFLFEHKLLHSSTPCDAGLKYVMRSDAMYRRL